MFTLSFTFHSKYIQDNKFTTNAFTTDNAVQVGNTSNASNRRSVHAGRISHFMYIV